MRNAMKYSINTSLEYENVDAEVLEEGDVAVVRRKSYEIFDRDGNHLNTWYQFSRISGLFIDANDVLYAIDSESDENYNPGWRKGMRIGSAETGEVWYYIPEHMSARPSGMGGSGSMGEGVTVDRDGNIYAGEVGPVQGLTKFVPRLLPSQ